MIKKGKNVAFILMLSFLLTSCGNEPSITLSSDTRLVETAATTAIATFVTTSTTEEMPPQTAAPTETTIAETNPPVQPTFAMHPEGTYIICIDPGHQEKGINGTEPVAPGSTERKAKVSSGTRGTTTGIPEYQLVLEIGLQLKELLEADGITVVMTRENHDVSTSNIERAEIANTAGADLFLRIHADGSEKSTISGMSMLIPGNEYIKNETLLSKSKEAGEIILAELIAATGAKNRGLIERNDMTGFNWSAVPVVLVETGFMTNPDEDQLLSTPAYQKKIVNGLYNGIMKWLSEQ